MKKIALVLLLFFAVSTYTLAVNKYIVDSNNSFVNFATIKKQFVVEPALISNISGNISKLGEIKIVVDLNSVDTNIGIRNTRLKNIFFNIAKFPKAIISAKIDPKVIKKIAYYKKMTIPASLEFYGAKKDIKLDILVAKVYRSHLLVSSIKPIVINANDYGIPNKNLLALAKTVGGLSISNKAGVNFVIAFKKDK